MFNDLPKEIKELIWSYNPKYYNKYDNCMNNLKYISIYLRRSLNDKYFTYHPYYNPGSKIELNNKYWGFIKYIKKDAKKLYPPVGSKFWGGLSDSDSSDSD
jgi:hypothetical protein